MLLIMNNVVSFNIILLLYSSKLYIRYYKSKKKGTLQVLGYLQFNVVTCCWAFSTCTGLYITVFSNGKYPCY